MDFMPKNIASFGGEIDHLTVLITVITTVALILAEAFLLYAVVRYRRSSGDKPSYLTGETWKQARYVLIPVMLIVCLDLYIDVENHHTWVEIKETLPQDGIHVGITAAQFSWTFTYPGKDGELGTNDDLTHSELHIPVGTNVTFHMTAKDVLHSLWIPAMRLKQDALPGRMEVGWMRAEEAGTFDIACSEICGTGHSAMAAKLVVQPQDEYARWVDSLQNPATPAGPQDLMKARGCFACHSVDGKILVGPSYKGLFGRKETVITDGVEREVVVDEAYLRKSILEPRADIVKGFAPTMPDMRGKLTDQEVDQIVEFLKTVK